MVVVLEIAIPPRLVRFSLIPEIIDSQGLIFMITKIKNFMTPSELFGFISITWSFSDKFLCTYKNSSSCGF